MKFQISGASGCATLAGYIESETCLCAILQLWIYFVQGLRQLSLIQTLEHICPQVSLGPNELYITSEVRTVGLSSTLESNSNHSHFGPQSLPPKSSFFELPLSTTPMG